ncbi:hypothetical protein AJ87_41345 [Rhizobium yanglingense]|nr:hypothetical protein AJ87_41345 [Rhizobium yanglingense]
MWHGPDYGSEALKYHPDVKSAAVAGRIITCVEIVDWSGTGTKDMLISAWDACYDGRVFLRRQIGTNPEGTPILGEEELVEGVRGYVTAVKDGDLFHLVSASRLRKQIYVFPNVGKKGAPEFGDPVRLDLDADWVKGNEYFHMARFHDIDGDGVPELIVGSDYWNDYWPNGLNGTTKAIAAMTTPAVGSAVRCVASYTHSKTKVRSQLPCWKKVMPSLPAKPHLRSMGSWRLHSASSGLSSNTSSQASSGISCILPDSAKTEPSSRQA